jgi:hypothetical protein
MSTADVLARIRAAGLTVAPDGADPGKVYVAPRERLTDELREMIRANKAALLAALSGPASTPDTPSTKAPPLPPKACATCAHYRAKPGQAPDGWCARHKVETWGAYAGGCAADWTPADPATRARERRRADVVARLEADPALRYSFDVANATPTAPAGGPVSVLLGLRVPGGGIVTGELRIPADRWPGIALFNERLRLAAEGKPS